MKTTYSHIHTILVASFLALGSTAVPADARPSNDIREGVKTWYTAYHVGEVDGSNTPQTLVEYVGEVALISQGQVELAFDDNASITIR